MKKGIYSTFTLPLPFSRVVSFSLRCLGGATGNRVNIGLYNKQEYVTVLAQTSHMKHNGGVFNSAPVLTGRISTQEACPWRNVYYLPVLHIYAFPFPLIWHASMMRWNNDERYWWFAQLERRSAVDNPLLWEYNVYHTTYYNLDLDNINTVKGYLSQRI